MEKRENELLDRARNVIRELREKLASAETSKNSEPIAVIGMACDFPGVRTDLDAFWKMIVEGRDAVGPTPRDRWDTEAFYSAQAPVAGKMNTRHAAFLGNVTRFDAAFFDVLPVEAIRMDPQQRIFLETAWHALEDAGLSREKLSGSDTGVFVGIHSLSMDYYRMQSGEVEQIDAYAASGNAHDVIGGRLAYWLNLHGPSVAINTACSSSLVALHTACRSLRAGDCSAAVVGGVNLLLSPTTSIAASQLEMLAGDGRSKTFDVRADGFGRGEGCAVVVLKPLADANRDRDQVLAIIRGSAINQDGRTNGLTAPNGLAQERLLRRALKDAGIAAEQVGYLETHGTGTSLGDPIEVEALAHVLGGSRRQSPCVLGAVKANIGHLEGGAGIAGVIKAILVLRNRYFPPVANLREINPHLTPSASGLEIPMRGQPWVCDGRRFAGVSSFGWSGTNAHVVLEEAPEEINSEATPVCEPVLVAISARTPTALRVLALEYARRLESTGRDELECIGYTSTVRRTHHQHRMAVAGTNGREMAAVLRARVNGEGANSADLVNEAGHAQMAVDVGFGISRLAVLYEQGAEVDWSGVSRKECRVVSLPQYPFEGQRYWLDESTTAIQPWAHSSAPQDWFYEVDWVERQLQAENQKQRKEAAWLVFDDGRGLAARLHATIRQHGERCVLIHTSSRSRDDSAEVAPQRKTSDRADQILKQMAGEGVRFVRAVYVAGEETAHALTEDALTISQLILKNGLDAKLWFALRGAQVAGRSFLAIEGNHAALWGFSRVFGLEQPEHSGAVITVESEEDAAAVYEEIVRDGCEDRVVLSAGRRLVPRLKRKSKAVDGRYSLRANSWYMLTGAFGGIGLDVAEWLIDHGACHLILVGRRSPSAMGKPKLLERLRGFQSRGIDIQLETCDVSDEASMARVFENVDRSGRELRGVIHMAGASAFSSVSEAREEDVVAAFRAKTEGARLLDRLTRERNLDHFVLFSSASVSIGSRNASLYAAANSCMNSVAEERRPLGLPALTVEWGLWDSSSPSEQKKLIAESGFLPMASDKAMCALESLLAAGAGSGVVAAIDWTILGPALEARGKDACVAELNEDGAAAAAIAEPNGTPSWIEKVKGQSQNDRVDCLVSLVSREANEVFGRAPDEPFDENCGLFQMGMNSLMSVQLKRRLEAGMGRRLPGTLTLTYPNVMAIARFLANKITEENADLSAIPIETPDAAAKTDDPDLASIAAMDCAETDAAIEAELATIQQMRGAQ